MTMNYSVSNPLDYRFLQIFSHSPKITKESTEKLSKLIQPLLKIYDNRKIEGIIKNEDTGRLVIFTSSAITASIINNPVINGNEKMNIVFIT